MAIFKCKMCGGALEIDENQSVVTCKYCGSQQTLPKVDDEKKLALFNRANNLRIKNEFDKAAGIYESIIAEFSEEAEAYWGLVLCKYGIEYVDDPGSAKKVPTCHRTLPTPIMRDEDFQQACENADISARGLYREEAKAIDGIQKKILEIAATEEPYDIFICYKETDDVTVTRTDDSSIAQDIYTAFTEMGYKVFYARNSLRKVAGTEYEPYIYAALSSAKVMLAIGTKYDYYDAVWVKNEWSRFISMMNNDSSKVLIPCFKNIDAYDIPEEFSNMQALDMADMMFFSSLEASVKRVLDINKVNNTTDTVSSDIAPLLKRAFMFLEDGEWKSANDYCEKVLDKDPENAQAYLVKLLVDFNLHRKEDLKDLKLRFDSNINYQKIVRFGDNSLIAELNGFLNVIQKEFDRKRTFCSKISKRIAAKDISLGIKSDGTVLAVGWNDWEQCEVSGWSDVVAASAGINFTVGLKSDGTVVAVGSNTSGESNVSNWTDIIAVSAGSGHTVGLRTNGTVVAVGSNSERQCNVSDWSDIIAISAGSYHTVGLKADGTVIAVGDNEYGQCDVQDWTNIVAISATLHITIGLKADGTVVAVGSNNHGQCNVTDWSNIISVSAAEGHTVGLKADGTVISTEYIGDKTFYAGQCNVSGWTDIVAIAAGGNHTIGLKSDGSLIATAYILDKKNYHGQGDVGNWKLFYNINNLDEEEKIERKNQLEKAFVVESGVLKEYRGSSVDIVIPEKVSTIGELCFKKSQIKSVLIPNTVTRIEERAFDFCPCLTSINVNEDNLNYSSVDGVLFDKSQKKLMAYPAGKTNDVYSVPDTVTVIGRHAFFRCTKLTSIIIPNSVTNIGNGAFSGCSNIISVVIPCGVSSIADFAFSGCTNLKSITIPDSVASIGKQAFSECTSLTSLNIPDSVTTIGCRAFLKCTSLASIKISNNITIIDEGTFYNCTSLTSVTLPTSLRSIGVSAFLCCTSLSSITFPNGVTNIDKSAFYSCTKLSSVTIPNTVTSVGELAFDRCSNLKTIYISDDLLNKSPKAFPEALYRNLLENKRLAEEKRLREQQEKLQASYRSQGLCQYCGGEFKGLLGKKCSKCGKPKDY